MSSITTQQTKLDLELVPKENRIDIRKCNGRIPRRLTPREPTFQVVLDAIALTPCYHVFLITTDVLEVYMHQFWNSMVREFDPLPSEEDTVCFLRELGHTGEINSINDVVVDQMHQSWRTFVALINRSLSGKTSSLDKLRLSRDQILLGAVPPKIARKFKKASPSKKYSIPVQADEELVQKGKRVKRSAKKSSTTPAAVALKRSQMKEVRKKSLRDFHKTHLSSSGTVVEKPPSVNKITPTVISEGISDKPGVPDVTKDDSNESKSESWGNDEDDNNNDQDSSNKDSEHKNESKEQVSDLEQEEESKDDDQEEDYNEESNDVNKNDEESDDVIKGDKEIVQGEGADSEMIDAQQGNENLETTQEQVVEDAHMLIYTVTKKTEVPVTISSRSSDLAFKFLNFLDIPHTDAEIVSPLDVLVHHEVPRTQEPTFLTILISVITESSHVYTNIPQSSQTFTPLPIITTPNPPLTIETINPLSTLLDFSSVFQFNDRITTLEKETYGWEKPREEFMNFLLELLTARIKEQVKDQMPQILPKEVSNFAPPVIEALIKLSRDEVTLEKVEAAKTKTKMKTLLLDQIEGTKSQLKSSGKYVQSEEPMFEVADLDIPQYQEGNLGDNKDEQRNETTFRLDWFKKPTPPQEPTNPDWHVGKTTQKGPTQKWLMTLAASTPTDKSLKDFDELISTLIDFSSYILNGLEIENLTQEILLGPAFRLLKGTRSNFSELEYDFEECYKALLEKLDWENPKGEYHLNTSSTMISSIYKEEVLSKDYTNVTTKTKGQAQFDLPGIEDNVLKHMEQSRGDVYSTKHILAVTHVKVMRKHGYRYLEEIVVRRADNALYRFKEGDFL
ncbi:hypothetical protein Tco_1309750 [Tanacetum coccineum]